MVVLLFYYRSFIWVLDLMDFAIVCFEIMIELLDCKVTEYRSLLDGSL